MVDMTPQKVKGPDIEAIMSKAVQCAQVLSQLDQKKTDHIVKKVFEAGFNHRHYLARLAYKETKLGKWKDKIIKNIIATQMVFEDIKSRKTVGVINEDKATGIIEIAQPMGPIFAITPITNPTSTVLFKILIALKTRNPIIIRPHGSAKGCSVKAAHLCYEAALAAGAPADCIQWIKFSSKEQTIAFMQHKKTALVLATGSVGLVRAAYASGNPAIGVGPGNVPVYIGESADIPFGVEQICHSKTFDNGTVCASEQALVVPESIEETVIAQLKEHNAYFLSEDEIKKVEKVAFSVDQKVMRVEVIGQPAIRIAWMAGIEVPPDTSILVAPLKEVGITSPLSLEILAPILAFYTVKDFTEGLEVCSDINRHGGLGHSVSIFSNRQREITDYAAGMKAGRVLVNTPASQGALGGIYNNLQPSLTLGCGSMGKTSTTDNVSVQHLLNIQRIAMPRIHKCAEVFSRKLYFDADMDAEAIESECRKFEID